MHCSGSSLFLKHRFGRGYILTCNMDAGAGAGGADQGGQGGQGEGAGGGPDPVLSLLGEHVTGARMLRCSGKERTYSLPLTEVPRFPAALEVSTRICTCTDSQEQTYSRTHSH